MKYKFDKQLKIYPNLPFCKAMLPAANAALSVLPKGIGRNAEYRKITADGLRLHIITPKNVTCGIQGLPCLFYIHGGGFGYKESFVHYRAEQLYATQTPCAVVGIDYDLLPKAKYPTAANQCLRAFRFVTQKADTFGINPNKIVVGGDSAGGSLALEVCRGVTDADVRPTGLMAVYPVVDNRTDGNSMTAYVDTPLWNAKNNAEMWRLYLDGEYRSPMLDIDKFAYLFHVFVEAEQYDCLRDQGEEFAEAMSQVVADVTLLKNQGTFHGFEINKHAEVTERSFAARVAFLKRCFD